MPWDFFDQIPKIIAMKIKVYNGVPTNADIDEEQLLVNEKEKTLEEIKERVKTRNTAKNNLKICATLKASGGCTKAFNDLEELARYILDTFGLECMETMCKIEIK